MSTKIRKSATIYANAGAKAISRALTEALESGNIPEDARFERGLRSTGGNAELEFNWMEYVD